MDFLRREGAVPAEEGVVHERTPIDRCADAYEVYLREGRALATATILNCVPFVREFLRHCFGSKPVELSRLCASDVLRFVRHQAPRLHRKRVKLMTTALRSFLRYARYCGKVEMDLAAAVPVVPNWSMTTIPRAIAPDQVRQLLASIDRRTGTGRRDYAIVLLLARLGLRSGEVASLTLYDVDWKAGQLTGAAIAAYLQDGRPHSTSRFVFLRAKAPVRGFRGASGVGSIIRHSLQRSGLDTPLHGRASVSPWPRHRDVASRRFARRDRRRAGSSSSADHDDLHEGRHRGIAQAGAALAGRNPMNTLAQAVQDYLRMRRDLGLKLREAGTSLLDFAAFMRRRRSTFITSKLALAWAQQPRNVQPSHWARRLSFVRGFARYRSATDPRTQIPPQGLLPFQPQRARPYLYSDDEISRLLRAALDMTYRCTDC